jgi:hypothetical protein
MKIKRTVQETVIMTGDEVKSFVTKYITKKTGKHVTDVYLTDDGDYEIVLDDDHSEEDLGE